MLAKYGYTDTAYKLLLQPDAPGWLYEVGKGATTVWETWTGIDENGKPHESLNHYSYGAICGWLFGGVCGIHYADGVLTIAPTPDKSLGSAKAAYELAIPEVVQYNPIVKTTCPAGADPEHREPITEEQQQWIRETPHRAQRAAMLLLYSGLRRGEATALTWADVDLKEATITVHSGYNFKDKKIKDPKTEAGVRVVNIPKILVDYLKTQQDDCLYVLHTVKGHRMTEQAWKTLWSSYMADLNAKYGYHGEESKKRPGGLPMRIEPFTPHQLRHTFCTLMYFAGVDVLTARDQMGHKDISVTLGIYTSLDKKFKKKKINRLDSYLKKQTG